MDNDTNVPVTPEETAESNAPVQSAFAKPSKKRSPKAAIAGIIAGALVLLGGGGALAYTMWYQNEDKVVHDAILNAIQAKTIATTGTIVYQDESAKVNVSLDSKGDEANGEFNVKAKIAIDNADMKHDFEANGSGRVIGDTLYVKVSGIKAIIEGMSGTSEEAVPAYLTTVADKIEGKWLSIKASDYKDFDEELSKQQTCFADLAKKMQSDKSMSDEVMKLYRNNQIIAVKEKLGSKSVNGTSSLGYKIELDEAATKAFVKGLKDTSLGKELKNCNNDVNFDEVADDITKNTEEESGKAPTVELWVSTFGHRITELSVRGDTDNSGKLNAVFQPTFNEKVTVEAPSDATSLKTFMEDVQGIITEYYADMFTNGAALEASSPSFQLSI